MIIDMNVIGWRKDLFVEMLLFIKKYNQKLHHVECYDVK